MIPGLNLMHFTINTRFQRPKKITSKKGSLFFFPIGLSFPPLILLLLLTVEVISFLKAYLKSIHAFPKRTSEKFAFSQTYLTFATKRVL